MARSTLVSLTLSPRSPHSLSGAVTAESCSRRYDPSRAR
jgi:hypothetical protein